jgi:hypothetical protein
VPSTVVAGVVGGVIALGVAALIWWATSGHGPSGANSASGTGTTTTAPATSGGSGLSGEALTLQRLLTHGNTVTYHATYSLSSTSAQAAGGSIAVEVWRKPPEERQDSSAIIAGSPAQHQEALSLPSGLVNCVQAGTGNWSCQSIGNALPSGPDAIVKQITDSLAQDQVTSRSATVATIAARCFDVTGGSTKLTLCVDADGIPVEVTDGTNTLEASEVDHHVAAGTFTPPAQVAPSTTTTSSKT